MSDIDIKAMVDRFLSWRLPEDFNPDGGVTFDPFRIPTGTNLFTAVQAEAMIRHMLGAAEVPAEPVKMIAIMGKHLELPDGRTAGIGVAEAPHDDGLVLMFCNPGNADTGKIDRSVKLSYEAVAALVEVSLMDGISDRVDIGFRRLREFQQKAALRVVASGEIEETTDETR